MKRCDCGCMEPAKDSRLAREAESQEPQGNRKAQDEGQEKGSAKTEER